MNKHKKNLETLRAYLNRDKQGLKLLADVARDITEQRKRIALLEASAEKNCQEDAAKSDRISRLESELLKIRTELSQERSLHQQTKRSKSKPKKQKEIVRSLPVPLAEIRGFNQSLKLLKRRIKSAPTVMAEAYVSKSRYRVEGFEFKNRVFISQIEDVAQNYGSADMETLGRIVTLAAMIGVAVTFVSRNSLLNKVQEDDKAWYWREWVDLRHRLKLIASFCGREGNAMRHTTLRMGSRTDEKPGEIET